MEPSLTIDASTVDTQDDGPVLSGWFGDLTSEPPRYLGLQIAAEMTRQDIELGMDGVYAERDDQQWGGYKGLQNIELQRDCLVITLNDTGKKDLGISGQIRVNFDLLDPDFGKLRRVLAKLCEHRITFDDRA